MKGKAELNYSIDLPSKGEWFRYFGEYKYLVDLTFRKMEYTEITVVSLPLAFLIRHTLELGYKTNLLELEKVSDIKANIRYHQKGAHKIDDLHKEFEIQVQAIFKKYSVDKEIQSQFNKHNSNLTLLKRQFHKLDKFSYAFRYPVQNDGITPNFERKADFKTNEKLNFKEIKELYQKSIVLLIYTTDVISEQINNWLQQGV